MSSATPVVLIAHGTRDERGRDELCALREAVNRGYGARVRVGVIEYPASGLQAVFAALADAAEEARATGVDEVRLVPLLLFPAGHARDDLAVILRGAARLHPEVRWRCMPLLRPSAPLLAALGARIGEAERRSGMRAEAIVLAGRGSSSAHANRRLPGIVCARLHQVDGRPVVHAFASLAEPATDVALEALYERGIRSAVVAPYLLNAGRIADRIGEQACEFAARHPGFRLVLADHLGLHPAVTAYVAARVRGERGTALRPTAGAAPKPRHPRPIVVAGTASGTGKTTLALGLMAALRRRGLRVQPFKVGPDFIDPLHHNAVAGRTSRNLDTVLCSARTVPALAARAMRDADVAVVEGVLGLYDGRLGGGDHGSTAEMARLLDADVVLVVDAARAARSTAAVALGFTRFDPRVPIAGVVLNRVGSARHEQAAREAIEGVGLRVLGAIPRDPSLTLPERYLGLVPPQERAHPPRWAEALGTAVEQHVDVDALLRIAAQPGGPVATPGDDLFALPAAATRARIAVARDAAFTFHYQDALDLLALRGAELVPFSPLVDAALPDCEAVILPGGFPERFAAVLRDNAAMRASVAAEAMRGLPIVAECGGAMYLGTHIAQEDGESFAMCGVLPYGTRMARSRRALGYRTARALRDSPMLRAGEVAHGHEFHWSHADPHVDVESAAYHLAETDAREGFAQGSVLASYVHLHLCGVPGAAARLVAAAERHRSAALETAR
ncbi:MAG TPA: cobyrinate a,c-diamide synthase [Candidatus Angelobacter sp.]|jgi:cobyrinic acid a,c-diamide synthase|nr:cobyrinate a,c-diamide synthase [Candidatus Angelobacter sp.]